MKWKAWKVGLLVSVITGVATGFGVDVISPTTTMKQTAFIILASVGKDLLLYLAKHPVDQISFDTTTITKDSVTPNK